MKKIGNAFCTFQIRRLLLASLMLASAAGVNAEEAGAWYQVEVIIFERLNQNQSGDAETWPKSVDLGYPAQWQKLVSPSTAEDMLAAIAEETEDLTDPASVAIPEPAEQPFTETGPETAVAPPEQPRPPVLTVGENLELAFVPLAESERTLNESAGGISRSRNTRVLFHEAWRQPIQSAEATPAIIVKGGNSYGVHTELEGSLQLSVSRYLHLNTNLWLTQFIPNYGQESEHWPPLPPIPEWEPPQPEEPVTDGSFGQQESPWNFETPLIDDYTSLINEPFLIKEIVVLQQSRRMRSGELHYIDHPRMGLLIKIDEYKPEAEQELE